MTLRSNSPVFWQALAKGAGLVSIALGLAVLIGWLIDSAVLKSIHPSPAAMHANTALGFFLSGGALYLKALAPAQSSVLWRRTGQVCAGAVTLLGLLTLVEYASGADLGIDQWLFQVSPGAIGTLAPGRMTPTSAWCFLSIGMALLLNAESRQGGRWVFVLLLVVALVALTAGLSFLYAAPHLVGHGYDTQMAAHSALMFLVLAGGMLCLAPDRGLIALLRNPGTGGMVTRRLLPVAIILQIVLEYLNQAGKRAGIVEAQFGVAGGRAWLAAWDEDPTALRPQPFARERVVEHAEAQPPLISRQAIVLTVEQLLGRALRHPRVVGQFVRVLRLRATTEQGGLWERTHVMREPTGDRTRLWTAVRALLEYAEFPGLIAGLELELGGLTGEGGRQRSLFDTERTRRHEQLDEMVRHLKVRYGCSPLARVVEVEPWSRIPERRRALMDYDP